MRTRSSGMYARVMIILIASVLEWILGEMFHLIIISFQGRTRLDMTFCNESGIVCVCTACLAGLEDPSEQMVSGG